MNNLLRIFNFLFVLFPHAISVTRMRLCIIHTVVICCERSWKSPMKVELRLALVHSTAHICLMIESLSWWFNDILLNMPLFLLLQKLTSNSTTHIFYIYIPHEVDGNFLIWINSNIIQTLRMLWFIIKLFLLNTFISELNAYLTLKFDRERKCNLNEVPQLERLGFSLNTDK